MATPDLFIGVVSYPGTRYPESSGPSGLGRQLSEDIPGSVVVINSEDLWLPDSEPDSRDARASHQAELLAEWKWARFLGYSRSPRFITRLSARWLKFFLRPARNRSGRTVTRLMNIELSHLDLWRRALDSGATYCLVLEDDANCADVVDLASGIRGWIADHFQPAFVNLSASFIVDSLQATALLERSNEVAWNGSVDREVLRAKKPITNTVCAVLYHREFLQTFVNAWMQVPESPVAPIDWKMNLVLRDMYSAGFFSRADAWWVEPAPIEQRSMS